MTDEQRIERIEAYLDKAMNEQERRDFEKEIAADEDLRKQVILQETIRLAFKNASDTSPLDKQIDDLFDQNRYRFEKKLDLNDLDADFWKEMDFEHQQAVVDTPPSVLKPVIFKNRRFLLAIAASFTLLLAIGWWWFAQKNVPPQQGQIIVDTEGGGSQPLGTEKTPNTIPKENPQTGGDKQIEKQKGSEQPNEQIANTDKQLSDIIQKITTLADVEKNMAATVMSSAAKQNLYETAIKKYVNNGDTKGFEDFLQSNPKEDSYQDIKRLVHAYFRLKNYEKSINYCLTGLKLTDLEADEKQELRLLLLESYYGDYSKYKTTIKNMAETGSVEEKNLIKTMASKGF